MLLKLNDTKLSRINAVETDDIPEYGTWVAQEPRGRAVAIPNDINLASEDIDLAGVELVVLDFPKYKDGRAYSQARSLRERYGFTGDIRATGDVLRDQILFMARCGFTSFELDEGAQVAGYEKSLEDFSLFYQSAVEGRALWQLRQQSEQETVKERAIA